MRKNKKDVKKTIAAHIQLPDAINYALFNETMDTLEAMQKAESHRWTPERLAREVYGVVFLNFHLLYWEEKTERVRLEKQAVERVGQIGALERELVQLRQANEAFSGKHIQEKGAETIEAEV